MKTLKALGSSFLLMTIFTSCTTDKTTPDNSVLSSQKFKYAEEFNDGILKTYTLQRKLKDINADYTVYIRSIEIDSMGSVLDSVKVVLNKGVSGYEFSSTIGHEQIKHNFEKRFFTSVIFTVGYLKSDLGSTKFVNKSFSVNSEGLVTEL